MEEIDSQQFLSTFRNAITHALGNTNVYVDKIQTRVEMTPGLWYVTCIVNNNMLLNCLCVALSKYTFQLFFPLQETRWLLIEPTLEDMRSITRNHYGIGHNK